MKHWLYPTGVERDYLAAIRRAQLRPLEQAIKDNIVPILPAILGEAERQDAPAPNWFDTVQGAFETTLRQANVPEAELRRIVERVAGGVDGFNRSEFTKVLKSVYRVDVITNSPAGLQAALGVFEAQNIALIKSIPVQALGTLQGQIVDAVRTGMPLKDLQKIIRDRYGVTDRRAELIARDQIGKLNGQLTRLRQEAMGITHYTWRGILDSRERPEHVAREGKVFAWDNPPSDGAPGSPVRCRCSAEPVLPSWEEMEKRITGQDPEPGYTPPAPPPVPRPPPPPPVPPQPQLPGIPRPPKPVQPLESAQPSRPIEPIEPRGPVAPPVDAPVSPVKTQPRRKPTAEDEQYVDYYKTGGQQKMNEVLRNPGAFTAGELKAATQLRDRMQEVISKSSVSRAGTLYRGINSQQLFNQAASLVGAAIPIKTPQSASNSRGSALSWLTYAAGALVLRIQVAEGAEALDLGTVAPGGEQREIVLPSGGVYRVTRVSTVEGVRYIDATLERPAGSGVGAQAEGGEFESSALGDTVVRLNANAYEIEDMIRAAAEQDEVRTGLR